MPHAAATRVLLGALVLAAALAAGLLTLQQPRASAKADCGTERWAVKTLADPAARRIDFTPKNTSVSALRALPKVQTYARGRGVERTTYRLRARLVETKQEDDQDSHLVVADPRHPSRTMIVEFPSPSCTGHSVKRSAMAQARTALAKACGRPSTSSFHSLRGTATIVGVGFFDYYHGQTGVAPNAIELHPVLRFSARSCATG